MITKLSVRPSLFSKLNLEKVRPARLTVSAVRALALRLHYGVGSRQTLLKPLPYLKSSRIYLVFPRRNLSKTAR